MLHPCLNIVRDETLFVTNLGELKTFKQHPLPGAAQSFQIPILPQAAEV